MAAGRVVALGLMAALLGAVPPVAARPTSGGEILWDKFGVAHVYAKTTEGLFYAYGFAQAKSHGDAVLKLYAQARGRAADVLVQLLADEPADRGRKIRGLVVEAELRLYPDLSSNR